MRRLEITCKGMETAPLTVLVLATLKKHENIPISDIIGYIQEYTCYKEKSVKLRVKYCRNHKWIKVKNRKYSLTRRGKKHLEKVILYLMKYIDYVWRLSK